MNPTNRDGGAALWEQVRQGSHAAFDELYQLYVTPLFTAVYRHTRHRADAEDIIQQVFLELWEKKASVIIHRSPFNYLYSMARYKTLHYLRATNTRPVSLDLFQSLLEDMAADEEAPLAADLTKEISLLPEQMRKVFILRAEAGMSITDIASQLMISPNTVRNHLAKVRKRLRYTISRLYSLLFSLALLLMLPNH